MPKDSFLTKKHGCFHVRPCPDLIPIPILSTSELKSIQTIHNASNMLSELFSVVMAPPFPREPASIQSSDRFVDIKANLDFGLAGNRNIALGAAENH